MKTLEQPVLVLLFVDDYALIIHTEEALQSIVHCFLQFNTLEHFTYLGSVMSSDATTSKDLDNRLSKASG